MQAPKRIQTLQKNITFKPDVPVDDISRNPFNPRKIFREKDINDLCNSIIEMGGIIVPLVVFEISPGKYVLLDGERRLIAARKLDMKCVPANVISGQLSDSENLSTMFNIHMAREEWDPASRAIALGRLKGLYTDISPERLAEITGMSKIALKDANRILNFPEDIVKRCLREGEPDYLRPSNLVEMGKAFEIMDQNLSDFFKTHNRDEVSRILVKKIDERVIRRNTDFRLIAAMFAFLPGEQVAQLLEKILKDPEMGISDAYELVEDKITSKRFDLFRISCRKFSSILEDFRFTTADEKTALDAISLLKEIREKISKKLELLQGRFS